MPSNNAEHGKNFQQSLHDLLLSMIVESRIEGVSRNVGVRHPGYANPNQYYAPFIVTFKDGKRWVLFSTTACRTDRIKGQQWDADHLKMLDGRIEKAFLVYPDDALQKEKVAFALQQEKYDNMWEFSRIDRILSTSELVGMIRSR